MVERYGAGKQSVGAEFVREGFKAMMSVVLHAVFSIINDSSLR